MLDTARNWERLARGRAREQQMVTLQMRTAATNATMAGMLAEATASPPISRRCCPGAKGPAGGIHYAEAC